VFEISRFYRRENTGKLIQDQYKAGGFKSPGVCKARGFKSPGVCKAGGFKSPGACKAG